MCKTTRCDSQWHLRGYAWLKPITNFKRNESSRGVCGPVVIILNNVQIGTPMFILGKLVVKGVNESMIDNLIFVIYLHVKGNKEINFSTQHKRESMLEDTKETIILIRNNATC